jgi:hypothetical protein
MGVASCRSIFLLSDVVFNRASVSPRFGFRFAIGFRSVVACVVGLCPGPRPSTTQPKAAQPSPGRAPLAPHPHAHLSLSLIWFSHAATPPPSPFLPPLSHLFALGDPVDGYRRFLDPKVSSPLLSLSLSLSLPFPLPCTRPCPPMCASLAPLGAASLAPARGPWPPRRRDPGPRRVSLAPCSVPLPPAVRGPCLWWRGAPAPALAAAQHLVARPVRSRARSPSVRDF